MPTKRRKRIIRRRGLPTADALWQAGRYAEAVALNEWIEFLYDDHVLTADEAAEAQRLREEMERLGERDMKSDASPAIRGRRGPS